MLMSQATQAMFLVAAHSEDTSAVKTSLFTWFCSLSRVHILLSLLSPRDAIMAQNISDGWKNEENRGPFLVAQSHAFERSLPCSPSVPCF